MNTILIAVVSMGAIGDAGVLALHQEIRHLRRT